MIHWKSLSTFAKGVTNMIRVHADKAVAMPIDTFTNSCCFSWYYSFLSYSICRNKKNWLYSWLFITSYYIFFFWYLLRTVHGDLWSFSSLNANSSLFYSTWFIFCIWCIQFIFTNKQLNMVNQTFEVHNNYLTSNIGLSINYWLYEM